ncbi:MAG: GNAT family protein [Vicinamibacterales bacterium]
MTLHVNALGQPIGGPVPDWSPRPRPAAAVLEGRYARLERLDPDRHGRALHEANRLAPTDASWTYLPVGPFATFDAYDTWLRQVAPGTDPWFYTVIERAGGRPVGVASYLRIDPAAGAIEVGHINFSPLAQRTSVATEAMFLMMQYAFSLGYRRYEWKCDALNAPSRLAAERLGFTFEGLFRQALVYKGRNRDTAWYSVIDREFPVLDGAFRAWLAPANHDADGRQVRRLADLVAEARPR